MGSDGKSGCRAHKWQWKWRNRIHRLNYFRCRNCEFKFQATKNDLCLHNVALSSSSYALITMGALIICCLYNCLAKPFIAKYTMWWQSNTCFTPIQPLIVHTNMIYRSEPDTEFWSQISMWPSVYKTLSVSRTQHVKRPEIKPLRAKLLPSTVEWCSSATPSLRPPPATVVQFLDATASSCVRAIRHGPKWLSAKY